MVRSRTVGAIIATGEAQKSRVPMAMQHFLPLAAPACFRHRSRPTAQPRVKPFRAPVRQRRGWLQPSPDEQGWGGALPQARSLFSPLGRSAERRRGDEGGSPHVRSPRLPLIRRSAPPSPRRREEGNRGGRTPETTPSPLWGGVLFAYAKASPSRGHVSGTGGGAHPRFS